MTWQRRLLVIAVAIGVVVGVALPAEADHSVSTFNFGEPPGPPDFVFTGRASQTDNSTLTLWVQNSGGTHYRVAARAGSGDGTTNSCTSFKGWLPAGLYGRGDGDPLSRVEHQVKTTGNAVVRGNVWFLNKKKCNGGSTERNELFIHSSGVEGTAWNNNWKSEGCIKVSQHARNTSGFTFYARAVAYDRNNERLTVTH